MQAATRSEIVPLDSEPEQALSGWLHAVNTTLLDSGARLQTARDVIRCFFTGLDFLATGLLGYTSKHKERLP